MMNLLHLACQYDVANLFNGGLAPVNKDGKWFFINTKGETMISCPYDNVDSFSEGLAMVCKDEKCGYINVKGEEVITCSYITANPFGEGLAAVNKNGKWWFINTKGEEVFSCAYDFVSKFSEGLAMVCKDGRCGYINKKGEEVIPCQYENASNFFGGFAPVSNGDNLYFINTKGEKVLSSPYAYALTNTMDGFSNGLACVIKDGKYGCINAKGEVIVPLIYDEIAGGLSNGVVLVALHEFFKEKTGSKHYGFADLNGNDTFSNKLKERYKESREDIEKSQSDETNEADNSDSKQQDNKSSWDISSIEELQNKIDGTIWTCRPTGEMWYRLVFSSSSMTLYYAEPQHGRWFGGTEKDKWNYYVKKSYTSDTGEKCYSVQFTKPDDDFSYGALFFLKGGDVEFSWLRGKYGGKAICGDFNWE